MLREVEAEEFLLPRESSSDRLLRDRREGPFEDRRLVLADVEERGLAGDAVALDGLGRGDRVVEPGQDLRRVAERVERADLGQRLEHALVAEPEVDPPAEVGEGAEVAALGAGRDDRFDRALADVLDGEQPEPDRVALDGELEIASGGRRAAGPRCPSAGTRRSPPRPAPRCRGTAVRTLAMYSTV